MQHEDDIPDVKEEEEAELYEDDSSSIVTDKDHSDEHVAEAENPEDWAVEDEEDEEDIDLTDEQKNVLFICQVCGKSFTRREMFDLHCHLHPQKDDLTPLTCEECGLTFQHRSGLVKHKNEHKQKEEVLLVPKKEMQTKDESNFECAECGRLFLTVFKLREHNCTNAAEKPYHCPLCRQDFQFKVSVTKHMMTHSQDKMFTCQECNQIFPNIATLRCHQRSHGALKPYECPECGMVFKHHSVMEDHRRRHTDNTRSFLCNICGKSFKYSSLFQQHQFLHTGQKPFQCPQCGKRFAFAQNMKAHCRQHRHKKTNSSNEEQPVKQSSPPVEDTVKEVEKENSHQREDQKHRFRCPFCSQSYSVPSDLKTHMLIHENEYETLDRLSKTKEEKNWTKGHTCSHCPSVFRDESSLRIHILSVHKTQAQCFEKLASSPKKQQNLPSSDFVQGKGVRDVFGVSHNKSYRCSECGKTFRHRSVLDLHMRIHSKDKPYQCKECGKSFRFNSYLQQHVIIHTGQKPYKCSDCGKEFAFLQNMRTHQRLHQEKPFRCTCCRKGYSDETQLQQHMLSHNGDKPHKCTLCDKSFGLAYLLRDHMNTHTGERPHRCEECNKTFSWFSSLLVHQKIHARKRQTYSHYDSLGSRLRGRGGSSVKKGDRSDWDRSRPLVNSGMDNSQSHPCLVSSLKDQEMHRNTVNQRSSTRSPHVDLQSRQQKDRGMSEVNPQPVQWKVDRGELRPVSTTKEQQHAAPQVDTISQVGQQQHLQTGPAWADSSKSSHATESAESTVGTLQTPTTKTSSLLAVNDPEQQRHLQPKLINWTNAPPPTMLPVSSSLQHDFSVPSYTDGAALWSVRPSPVPNQQKSPNKLGQEHQVARLTGAPVSTLKEPTTPKNEESMMWDTSSVNQPEKLVLGLAGASTSAQIDQSSAIPSSAPLTLGAGSSVWDIKTPQGIPKTNISPEGVVNHDVQVHQKQASPSPGWVNLSAQTSTPKVSISTPYEPHCFGQGLGTSVWGFQSNPVGQTVLTGQLKAGNGAELQQQHLVTGTQLIINQPSPFLPPLTPIPPLALPGPHPLHSVTVGTLPRPPHTNIFFTPQAVMGERPHVPQSLLAPQTEPHKLGPRLPFTPERLLQCMICGCSFPRELDLQMHYLQHAQGEI